MKKENKYGVSMDWWQEWRDSLDVDPIQDFINWEWDHGSFKLECWNVRLPNDKYTYPVIFQFWPNGGGFIMYKGFDLKL